MVEIAIAVALVAGLATMSVPLFSRMQRAQQFRGLARNVSEDLLNARGIAASGKRVTTWTGPNNRIAQAGLYVSSSTAYSIFIDRNAARDGDEITSRTFALPPGMEITSPLPGTELRFRHNGTVVAPVNIVLNDRLRGKSRTLVITGGGAVRID